jgi:hypothetical protein
MSHNHKTSALGNTVLSSPRIRCRQIEDVDTDAIAHLLTKSGFSGSKEYWLGCLHRLAEHPTPAGYPKYGFLLEVNGMAVGVLLLITTSTPDREAVRCNVSSWFVWPAFSAYAPLLVKCALSCNEVTYFNISPLPHTFKSLIAQGYILYCDGRYVAIPVVGRGRTKGRAKEADASVRPGTDLSHYEVKLLTDHAAYGCLSIVVTVAGNRYPFVFQVGRKFHIIRFAYLIYCRDLQNFLELAKPIARFLAKRAIFLVMIDANGPIDGLIGRYRKSRPKYFKGPSRPQLGDVAYSERVLFNIG